MTRAGARAANTNLNFGGSVDTVAPSKAPLPSGVEREATGHGAALRTGQPVVLLTGISGLAVWRGVLYSALAALHSPSVIIRPPGRGRRHPLRWPNARPGEAVACHLPGQLESAGTVSRDFAVSTGELPQARRGCHSLAATSPASPPAFGTTDSGTSLRSPADELLNGKNTSQEDNRMGNGLCCPTNDSVLQVRLIRAVAPIFAESCASGSARCCPSVPFLVSKNKHMPD